MQNKKNNAQDTLITPEQVDLTKSKNIEKRVEALCDRLERNYNDAMEFQAMPMLVYPADDIKHAIEGLKQRPDTGIREMKALEEQIKTLNSSMDAHNGDINTIAENIKGTYDVLSSFYKRLDDTEKTNEKTSSAAIEMHNLLKRFCGLADAYQKKLADAESRENLSFIRRTEARFKDWWNSRKGFWWRFGLFCCTVSATVLMGLYCCRWSDDAWARRAYDAAVGIGHESPERVYHQARTMFNGKGRKETKERIRQYEDDLQSAAEKEE